MKRETSAYERVMFYYSKQGPMYFAFRLVLDGILDEGELRTALLKVRKEFPLTAVRVYKDHEKKQWITTEEVPAYPLTITDNFTGDPTDEVIAQLRIPFDHERGPMVRFTLLRNGRRNDLIVVFHHAVGDGVGASLFLERLLEHLGNPETVCIPVREETWAPQLHEIIPQETVDKINQFDPPPYKTDKSYTNYTPRPHDSPPFPRPSFALQNAHFNREETARLVAAAKKADVTVHSFLGAILLKIFAEQFGPDEGYERTIQSPINFRPQLIPGADRMFGLFNGLITTTVDCAADRSITDIAQEIGSSFHRKIGSLKPLAGYYNFMSYLLEGVSDPEEFYANRKSGGTPMNYDFSFSNLGVLTIRKTYGKLILQELYGPTFSATKGERVIGALTLDGELFMTLIYDAACFDHTQGKVIWTKVQKAIRSLS